MELKEIRIQNLKLIIEENDGDRSEVARRLKYTDVNYFNQLVSGHGSFGNRTARKVEETFSKPEGWMNQNHGATIGDESPLYDLIRACESAGLSDQAEIQLRGLIAVHEARK